MPTTHSSNTIIVTGGSGLVGSAIQNIISDYSNYKFIFLSSVDINLLNYEKVYEYFMNIKPRYVIHLAANVGGLFKNIEYPVEMLDDNLKINSNVLKAAYYCGSVLKLVACLSTCIFPDLKDDNFKPITESDLHLGPPHNSNAAYAYAKRILQVQCDSYNKEYGCNFVCVIPTNIYGPNDNFNLQNSHVIPGLIHKAYLASKNGEKFIISGTGKPLRQFIHSEDLAKCIMWFLFDIPKDLNINTIILSPDPNSEITIGYISELIAKEFNLENNLEYDITKSDGQFKKTASNNLFRTHNPSYKFIDIETGIKTTVDWFKKNNDIARK
jgi:GDP-L-fucose synthase